MLKNEDINLIFENLEKTLVTAETELKYLNHYTLLIAVILSAQSTDLSVNKATESLFKIVDSPEKMLSLGEEKLKQYIKTIGLYNVKAKNIISLSQILVQEYNSEIPKTLEELVKLPGVGRKTANVVLNCLFKLPAIAVDTHVFRVSNRLGLAKEQNIYKLELLLLNRIPKKWLLKAHNLLVLHGRYICKAKKPKCPECNIAKYCEYFKKNNEL